MKIIFNDKFYEVYDSDPAAEAGRLEPTVRHIENDSFYEFIKNNPATEKDILRAHGKSHYDRIKRSAQYEISMLAAGGAILAAEYGYDKEAAFGLIRPPGHHASADSCWGFCFYNNMSICLLKLIEEKKINSAFILDFDLHVGDGNINIIGQHPGIKILNPHSNSEKDYLDEIIETLDSVKKESVDIICVSAGFDNAIGDWGGTLSREGYRTIGKMLREYSEEICEGRRFALLEGGYNHKLMAINLDIFCKNFG